MWITKIIGTISQICIITLAVLLLYQFASRQAANSRIDSVEATFNKKLDELHKDLNDKILVQQDNVNRYIQLREDRAKLYSKRIDDLYELYQKDPTPIIENTPSTNSQPAPIQPQSNINYIENRVNKVEEKVDSNNNKLSARVDILEQRMINLQSSRNSNVKVVQTNLQTVNNK